MGMEFTIRHTYERFTFLLAQPSCIGSSQSCDLKVSGTIQYSQDALGRTPLDTRFDEYASLPSSALPTTAGINKAH